MGLATSICTALTAVVLTAGVVLGQELLPEAALLTYSPLAATPPASPPFAITPPESPFPEVTPLDAAPPEAAPSVPRADTSAAGRDVEPGRPGRGMGEAGMAGLGMGRPGYGATWYPARPVSGSAAEELGLLRQNLSAALPVWRNGGDILMLSARLRNSLFFTDAILPDSHRPFPDELWNVSLGTNYMHKFDNGWSGMLGINFGSASDKPFHSIKEMNVGFMSSLQVPVRNDRDAWRFMLMYSPVGTLNFPIPGIAYLWNPSETFQASIGLPFSVTWRPTEDLTFNLSYLPLITVNARATYRLVDKVFLYGGYESLQEAYLLADREQRSDRFMGFEQRLVSGVRWDVWQHAALEMNTGYAFDRYFGVGKNQIGNLHDRVDIASGAFISTSLHAVF